MKNKNINYRNYFDINHSNRSYRQKIKSNDLISFQVEIKESDLLIQAPILLQDQSFAALNFYRKILEDYIKKNPQFSLTLKPYPTDHSAHPMIREMIAATTICRVGPMAAVAGCLSQYVAESLLKEIDELIVENGGDLYIKSPHIRKAIIYAGSSPLSNKIFLKIDSREKGVGLCTSSATVGPSYSMGKADAVTVISHSAALADAAATAIGNIIQSKDNIEEGLEIAQTINGLIGLVIIKDDKMGMWGEIEYGFI